MKIVLWYFTLKLKSGLSGLILASSWAAQTGELVPKIIKIDNKIVKNGTFFDTESNLGVIL